MELDSQKDKRAFKFVMSRLGKGKTEVEALVDSLISRGLFDEDNNVVSFLRELDESEYPVKEQESWISRTDLRGDDVVQS